MADFLYRADLLPRGDVYTPYDTGVARVGSVFTLITVVNNNVKLCINREFNPELPLGSAVLYTWPIFHHFCDYFIFLEEEGKGGGNVLGFFYFIFLFCVVFVLEEYLLLGQLLSRCQKTLLNTMGNLFPWQFRSSREKQGAEVVKEE